MNKESLESIKKEYMNPPIPPELESRIQKGLQQGRKQQQRNRFKKMIKRTGTLAAAATVLFTVALNSSPAFAASFTEVPLINRVVQVLTIKDYQFDENRYMADISTPAIQGLENKSLEATLNKKYLEDNQERYQQFMKDMEEMEEAGGGHLSVYSDYEIVTDNEQILSIRRTVVNTIGSSSTTHQYDTIDTNKEVLITLPSLFKDEQYIQVISQFVKEEMITKHSQDPNNIYWIEEIMEEPDLVDVFQEIDPHQNFYINEDHTLVISFDKYEVAPGYMGVVEFEIPTSLLQALLVSDAYLK